jgi:amino acid adenylation domain-containing protein/non-ribosomal peptide synthase protein (TIGR01720 family)
MTNAVEMEKIYSLSPMQEGMLFHALLEKDSSAYFEQNCFNISGKIDIALLEESHRCLLERYEVLRTVFVYEKVKKPMQVVLKNAEPNFVFEDISHWNPDEIKEYKEKYRRNQKNVGFQLTKDLPTRFTLFKTGESSYQLVWSFHHIIMDGWCLGTIFKDLIEIYLLLRERKPLNLEPAKPYQEYIKWLKKQDKEAGLRYWTKYLEGCEDPTRLPVMHPEPQSDQYKVSEYSIEIEEALTVHLNQLATAREATLNTLFQTLWGILLQRYNGTNDVTFGAVVSGRPPGIEGVESMVGLFINTVPVRIKTGNNCNFTQLLREVQREAAAAKSYEFLPLAEIQACSPLKRELINHIMVFENYPVREVLKEVGHHHNLEFEIQPIKTREQSNYHFNIMVAPGKTIIVTFNFNSEFYSLSFIKRIASHFNEVIRQVVENPHILIRKIDIIPQAEKKQLAAEFNNTQTNYPTDKTIHQLFEEQVQKTPNQPAAASPINLAEVYEELENKSLSADGVKRIAACCFRQSPFLYRSRAAISHKGIDYTLLKSHHHNCVLVDRNTLKLLDLFDSRQHVGTIFSTLTHLYQKPLKFHMYASPVTDILEITYDFSHPAEIFSSSNIEAFISLVKRLYRCNLLDFTGINPGENSDRNLGKEIYSFDTEESGAADNILLRDVLYPPRELTPARVLLLGDTPGMATTGVLYLASYLKRNGVSARCQFYDPTRDYHSMRQNLEKLLKEVQPDIVAISLKWSLYIARVRDMCRIIKDFSPRVKLVIGGNTASFYWKQVIADETVDYVIRGDGELPLLKLCKGESPAAIPNIAWKTDEQIIENPIAYIQDDTDSPGVYLSHLEQLVISEHVSRFGTFFIYTHKGCRMNCCYCGGCRSAQQKTFNREKVMQRKVEDVRKDIIAAQTYTSTFQFDFDIPNENLEEYCREMWEGIDLSNHFCIFSNLKLPTAQLLELVTRTFKYVYCDIDTITLSERHRRELTGLGLVKPQPTNREILAFLHQCEKYENLEVRINLITGLPYFTWEDITLSEKFLSEIMNNSSRFSELHWARLHAQPGAPIVEKAGTYDMHSYAVTFEDFLQYSENNFNRDSGYSPLEKINYPYIYFNNDRLNSRITQFYSESNLKVARYRENKERGLLVENQLTYQQLNRKSSQLAAALRKQGIGPGAIVGLLLEPSVEIPVSILAILKAGGAYLPLSPDYPGTRIKYMIEDSGTGLVVTHSHLKQKLSFTREILVIDDENIYTADEESINPGNLNAPSDVVYTIYTSGTTGKSKGVLVKHENLVNYVHWFAGISGLTRKDKTLLTSSFAFDLGYTTLYTSLLKGCRLHLPGREIYLSPERVLDYIESKEISYIKMTPSLFTTLVHHPKFSAAKCRGLRLVVLGGEAIDVGDLEKAHRLCPHIAFMNHYGPTEATIGCVAQLIDFDGFEAYRKTPVIGKPIANTQAFILDKDSNLLPMGVPGELCISGHCLARGYLNRSELTAEKFDHDRKSKSFCGGSRGAVFSKKAPLAAGGKIYKTGDLARWLPEGVIEFLGRIDNQVKIKGYRVELGEIETRLLSHPQVEEATVIVRQDDTEDKYLCAYIVPVGGEERKTAESASAPYPEFKFKPTDTFQNILKPFEQKVQQYPHKIAVKSASGELTYETLDSYARVLASEIVDKYDDRYQLSKKEKVRYKRQMLLEGWGVGSQEILKSTTVFVAGAGGGASPTITQLALAGVGTIIICDFDEVELSNLNRQFLHDDTRLGMSKAVSAKMSINRINPHVNAIARTEKITAENVEQLVGNAAIIFDMLDDLESKFILSGYAVKKRIPHIISAMTDISSYTAIFHTPFTPCFHCLFDKAKYEEVTSIKGMVDNYEKKPLQVVASSLFTSTGFAVTEAFKILLGFENPAYNKYFLFNQRASTDIVNTDAYRAMTYTYTDHFRSLCQEQGFDWNKGWRGNYLEELSIEPDPHCPVCGSLSKVKWEAAREQQQSAAEIIKPWETENKIRTGNGTVALLLEKIKDRVIAIPGAFKAGKKVVLLDGTADEKESIQKLEDCEARVIVTDDAYFDMAEKMRDKVNKRIALINISRLNLVDTISSPPGDLAAAPLNEESFTLTNQPAEIWATLLQGETYAREKHPYSFSQLGEFLIKDLPHYMIPNYFVQLDKMPLTPNGKVDRKALPEPETTVEIDDYIAPESEIEKQLVEILTEVLGVKKIGTNDNFFKKGLDSIKAIQITSRLLNYSLKVEIGDIFSNPTIKQMSHCVVRTDRVIPQDIAVGGVELTPIQRWFFENHFSHRHHYNMPVMLYREQGFDEAAVKKTFEKVLEHHDALRMVFTVEVEDEAGKRKKIKQVNKGITGKLPDMETFDLRGETGSACSKIVEKKCNTLQRNIDLEKGPLVKLGLFKTAHGDHLLIVIHHLVIDGISWRILLEDIALGYQQVLRGEEVRFQLKTDSFKYWSGKLKEYAASAAVLKESGYWKRIEETLVDRLPVDDEIGKEEKTFGNSETITLELDEEKTGELLKEAHEAYTTEINDLLLSALGLALKQWVAVERTAVYLEGHGREPIIKEVEISRTIGWFTTQYPVILDMTGQKELSHRIKHVKENLRGVPNKGIGYGILRYITPPEKRENLSFTLEPEISFNYMGEFGVDMEQDEQPRNNGEVFRMSSLSMGNSTSPQLERPHHLFINGMTVGGRLRMTFTYNKHHYRKHTIETLTRSYKQHLIEVIEHCTGKKEKELTPNDLDYSDVTIDELEELQEEIIDID